MARLRVVALQPRVHADACFGERGIVSPDGEPRCAVPKSSRVGNDRLDYCRVVDHAYSIQVLSRCREELAAVENGGDRIGGDGDILIHFAQHATAKRREGSDGWRGARSESAQIDEGTGVSCFRSLLAAHIDSTRILLQ